MMIEKAQRCPNGECMKPQRDFCEFNSHKILVDAVHTALQDHSSYDMTIVELFRVYSPATPFGVGYDGVSNRFDPIGKWGDVVCSFDCSFGLCHRCYDLVR